MTPEDAYAALMARQKEITALGSVAGLLSWDQEALMPPKGAAARSEEAGVMASVIHAKQTDAQIGDWLDAVDGSALDPVAAVNVREMRRTYGRAVKVPGDLATELSRTTSKAQQVWAQARADKDFAAFAPTLETVLKLTREKAAHLREHGQSLYDALLEDYEPGTTADEIAAIFADLRGGLADLRARIAAKGDPGPEIIGTFPSDGQMALTNQVVGLFGYDFDAGRIDLVTHPFCSGTRGDVRLTTRVDEADPFNCLYSSIHECGHALYEQGLDPVTEWQPAGQSVSMAVHESQSRLCENQIGRSEAFVEWLFPEMVRRFGPLNVESKRDFYRALNRVAPGFIRTEADEVHYNLHIMMRFELERALIAGDLEVKELEAAWNDRFQADFGVPVPDPALGVLQDVHWSVGLFGYFPTYALGNIYAGCLFAAMRRDLPDMDSHIARAEFGAIREWLRDRIHLKGSMLRPPELIASATGAPPSPGPLLDYLEVKFGDLYGL